MIVQLGAWVLEQGCRQLSAWQKSVPGLSSLMLHVNVSVVQLVQPGFAQRVKEIVEGAKLKPAQVTLEVTESVLIDRLSAALPNLRQLREYGVQISIDDFGTGYSSFGSMVDLPIGEIKIDRSFVSRLARSGEGDEVVRAIIAMGHAIGKRVVAEGIETDSQQRKLVELGCEGGQGYLLARPLTPWDVETMLKEPRLHTVAA
jgi:EAL domain-containing protein (putative c-di-GMP-specific phosphodiesterase class I)